MGPSRLSRSLLLLRCWRAAAAFGAARSARPLSAAIRLQAPQRPPVRGEPPRAGGQGRWKGVTGAGGDEQEDEEEEQDGEEDEELEELLGPSPLAVEPGTQRVVVVHPDVKWGSKKSPLTTGAWRRRAVGSGSGGWGRVQPPAGRLARRGTRQPAAPLLVSSGSRPLRFTGTPGGK